MPAKPKKHEKPVKPATQAPLPALTRVGKLEARPIVTEMQESYLDYAMSVIIARALPDVRDGMKPVHRRILFAMKELGLTHSARYRKSATVVGEVLGKYHPHGDSAVYETMVRLAQDFAMRYPLVQGQGNFGSMDGDRAAAMRYTEARLAKISQAMLLDIDKNTVDFVPNYDGTKDEPSVLPALLPNLLVNGAVGIAVGMATSIPPHNLTEVCNAISHLIDNPEATVDDLMEHVKGQTSPPAAPFSTRKKLKRPTPRARVPSSFGQRPILSRRRTVRSISSLPKFPTRLTSPRFSSVLPT